MSGSTTLWAVFGRFNPPHYGHEYLLAQIAARAKEAGTTAWVYVSPSHDRKKNPLPWALRVHLLQRMIRLMDNIEISAQRVRSPAELLYLLSREGRIRDVRLLVGADRVADMELLARRYSGEMTVTVDSLARFSKDATNMSRSRLRTAVRRKRYNHFRAGLPSSLAPQANDLYHRLRQSLRENADTAYSRKAIFVLGPPGSGKTTFAARFLGHLGLVEVDSDIRLEYMIRREGGLLSKVGLYPKKRELAKKHMNDRLDATVAAGMGFIYFRTGHNPKEMLALRRRLVTAGYNVLTFYCEVSDAESKIRNQSRPRIVPETIRQKKWKASRKAEAIYERTLAPWFLSVSDQMLNMYASVTTLLNGFLSMPAHKLRSIDDLTEEFARTLNEAEGATGDESAVKREAERAKDEKGRQDAESFRAKQEAAKQDFDKKQEAKRVDFDDAQNRKKLGLPPKPVIKGAK